MPTKMEPLLEKKMCYSKCPGCIQDRRKEAHTGVPYKEFFFVWAVTLCTTLPICSLFPFLYFMIRDLHVAKREEDIGFYAGFVGSAFMVGRIFTSVLWGIVADRYGRKPVIMISIFSVIIFNTLFGLSTTYWMAITTRFLLGLLNGLLGPIKAYASEVCREEHQALGLALLTTARGIGLIIGPAIGGFLAQPAENYPDIFSKESFFGTFPYFLPCLCISLIAAGAFIACFWLPETLHMHGRNEMEDGLLETPGSSAVSLNMRESDEKTEEIDSVKKESLLRNWPLMSAMTVYCVFSLQDMAYSEIFSLWAVSDRKYGGLSFSSKDVGEVLSMSGLILLLYQVLLYPHFARVMGPVISARVAAVLTIPLLIAYPFMTDLSGFVLSLVVTSASVLKNVLSVTIITGMNILQNNAVPQRQRGTANGISVTAMSLFKAIAPASAGAIFSWAQKRQHASFFPGDQMVFLLLNVTGIIGTLLTFKPFLAQSSIKFTA